MVRVLRVESILADAPPAKPQTQMTQMALTADR
jgi:hypothetical protein